MYIADKNNNRIRKVTGVTTFTTAVPTLAPTRPDSIISTFAGNGNEFYSGDGLAATAASFNCPAGIVADSSNNIYFNEMWNHRVRMVSAATGIITTYAGTGSYCCSGVGVDATSASIDSPVTLAIDSSGK